MRPPAQTFRTTAFLLGTLCSLSIPGHGHAQQSGPSVEGVLENSGASSLNQPVSALRGLQLNATSDGTNATLKYGNVISYGDAWGSAISFSATMPIQKSTNASSISGLAELPSAFTLGTNFNLIHVFGTKDPTSSIDRAQALCDKAESKMQGDKTFETQIKMESDILKAAGVPADKIGAAALAVVRGGIGCDAGFIAKWDPADEEAFQEIGWVKNSFELMFGVTGNIGYNDFKYYQLASTNSIATRRYPWSVGTYVSWQPPVNATMLTLSFKYQQAYKDAKTQIGCPGKTGNLTKDCFSGPLGTPGEKIGDIASLEIRHSFGQAPVLGQIAIDPTFSYDARQRIYGFNFPIYVFQAGASGFAGGPQIAWSSDTHSIVAGIFLNKAFQAIPGFGN